MFGSSVDTEASPPLPEIGVLPSSIPSTSRYAMSVALMINMAMMMMVIMMMVMMKMMVMMVMMVVTIMCKVAVAQ